MGYYSDVRFILTKSGYERLKEIQKEALNDDKYTEKINILDDVDEEIYSKYYVMLTFNYKKWYDSFEEIQMLENSLSQLTNEGFSYSQGIIGESLEDIEEKYHIGESSLEDVPLPSFTRDFDDKYTIEQMKSYDIYEDKRILKEFISNLPSSLSLEEKINKINTEIKEKNFFENISIKDIKCIERELNRTLNIDLNTPIFEEQQEELENEV